MNNLNLQKACYCLIIVILPFLSSAQKHNYLNDVVINPPNAAAIEKYGNMPISMHTGTPSISIPIYTVKEGDLSLPISLSYHASGIKVAETATWIGLGWALNAGGAITRTVRNAPDEGLFTSNNQRGAGWYLSNGENHVDGIEGGENWSETQTAAFAAFLDTEPDVFNFSAGGYSGKFMFKSTDSLPTVISEQDIKIQPVFLWDEKRFDYWIITTPDGVKYYFGEPGNNEFDGEDKAVDLTFSYHYMSSIDQKVVSAWYLTKIVSQDGSDVINLDYVKEKYGYKNLGSERAVADESMACPMLEDVNFVGNQVVTEVSGARLSSITSTFDHIALQTATERRIDLDSVSLSFPIEEGEPAQKLEYILINDGADNCLQKFKLVSDYFISTADGFVTGGTNDPSEPSDRYRLRLNQVKELNCAETESHDYNFSYYSSVSFASNDSPNTLMPRRKSHGQDAWGFNNGKISNKSLLPTISYQSPYNDPGVLTVCNYPFSADRDPAFPAMLEGTLDTIQYPTGGKTFFDTNHIHIRSPNR